MSKREAWGWSIAGPGFATCTLRLISCLVTPSKLPHVDSGRWHGPVHGDQWPDTGCGDGDGADGQHVAKGDPLLPIEAMKMEMQLVAECPGTIADVYVQPGDRIQSRDLLVTLV
jgi:hypothetical protein